MKKKLEEQKKKLENLMKKIEHYKNSQNWANLIIRNSYQQFLPTHKPLRSSKKIQCNDIGDKLYSHENP